MFVISMNRSPTSKSPKTNSPSLSTKKIDCVYSDWSEFGPCDGKQQSRTRTIITQANKYGKPCTEPLVESRECNENKDCEGFWIRMSNECFEDKLPRGKCGDGDVKGMADETFILVNPSRGTGKCPTDNLKTSEYPKRKVECVLDCIKNCPAGSKENTSTNVCTKKGAYNNNAEDLEYISQCKKLGGYPIIGNYGEGDVLYCNLNPGYYIQGKTPANEVEIKQNCIISNRVQPLNLNGRKAMAVSINSMPQNGGETCESMVLNRLSSGRSYIDKVEIVDENGKKGVIATFK